MNNNNKKGFSFFDQIYVINLENCIERKEHIKKEFEKHSIENYQFFKASSKRSKDVSKLEKDSCIAIKEPVTNLEKNVSLKRYPPCFRCHKDECFCENNFLVSNQLGNWISFIKIFEDIVEKGHQNVLICEDDISFYKDASLIMDNVFSDDFFKKNNLSDSDSILIRLEDRNNNINPDPNDVKLIESSIKESDMTNNRELIKYMSNACFYVNKNYAIDYLNNLETIDHTSDVFIHCKLPLKKKDIKTFNLSQKPSHQLSSCSQPKFYSEIHPRGIDDYDIKRKKKHVQRIEYHDYVKSQME